VSPWNGAPPVIVDTNVLIGQWMTDLAAREPMHILDGMRSGALRFAVCDVLLAEYREVLLRPKLQRRHLQDDEKVDAFIAQITAGAIRIETQPGPKAPDPGDQMLWDLLASRADLQLVTGDRLLLKNSRMLGRVLTPEAFAVAWLQLDAR
jgi:putative PIN family toxin of toxin-antitoxin system